MNNIILNHGAVFFIGIMGIIFIIVVTLAYHKEFLQDFFSEKSRWNNGYCRCGGKWWADKVKMGGAFEYECKDCKKHIIISDHRVDDPESKGTYLDPLE